MNTTLNFTIVSLVIMALCGCNVKERLNEKTSLNKLEAYITTCDKSQLISKQKSYIQNTDEKNSYPVIEVDNTKTYQTIDGFGYTLTGGTAFLINKMDYRSREKLLNELFGSGDGKASISYLRISIGSSDLDLKIFSYNDIDPFEEDLNLEKFDISQDDQYLIPILKEILEINPEIKIMATPWSPPIWMKTNKNSKGGNLELKYYSVYADYLVSYLVAMKTRGINIDMITIQNEPLHGGNNPSMLMSSEEQLVFIKNHLGPKFVHSNIKTKISIYDHNCDNPQYPIDILNDKDARKFIDGSAFHLYGGDIGALTLVHDKHPDKNLYFTEQWTGVKGSFGDDLKWHTKNVIIGSMRNWSKIALEWNLANDPRLTFHTPGGCTECLGALTIDHNNYTKNVSFYIIAQVSSFVPTGSKRIWSSMENNIQNVCFLTPSGKKVLIVLNESDKPIIFNITYKEQKVTVKLQANAVATYIWR